MTHADHIGALFSSSMAGYGDWWCACDWDSVPIVLTCPHNKLPKTVMTPNLTRSIFSLATTSVRSREAKAG